MNTAKYPKDYHYIINNGFTDSGITGNNAIHIDEPAIQCIWLRKNLHGITKAP